MQREPVIASDSGKIGVASAYSLEVLQQASEKQGSNFGSNFWFISQ